MTFGTPLFSFWGTHISKSSLISLMVYVFTSPFLDSSIPRSMDAMLSGALNHGSLLGLGFAVFSSSNDSVFTISVFCKGYAIV